MPLSQKSHLSLLCFFCVVRYLYVFYCTYVFTHVACEFWVSTLRWCPDVLHRYDIKESCCSFPQRQIWSICKLQTINTRSSFIVIIVVLPSAPHCMCDVLVLCFHTHITQPNWPVSHRESFSCRGLMSRVDWDRVGPGWVVPFPPFFTFLPVSQYNFNLFLLEAFSFFHIVFCLLCSSPLPALFLFSVSPSLSF